MLVFTIVINKHHFLVLTTSLTFTFKESQVNTDDKTEKQFKTCDFIYYFSFYLLFCNNFRLTFRKIANIVQRVHV